MPSTDRSLSRSICHLSCLQGGFSNADEDSSLAEAGYLPRELFLLDSPNSKLAVWVKFLLEFNGRLEFASTRKSSYVPGSFTLVSFLRMLTLLNMKKVSLGQRSNQGHNPIHGRTGHPSPRPVT
jgi:hypothetical protein